MEEERNREGRTTNEERRKNRTSNKGRNPETDTGEPRTSKKKSSTIHEEREDENTDTNGRAWKLRKVVRKQKENPKAPTDEEENHHILQTPASPLISPGNRAGPTGSSPSVRAGSDPPKKNPAQSG